MFLNRFSRLRGVGRYACLGTAVLDTLGRKYKMHNMQKGRVDYQLKILQDASIKCRPDQVMQHLAREYIAPTICQQPQPCPEFRPELILIDSFAELSDQVFRHKKTGWEFCCNYSDLTHAEEFNKDFDSLGLMNLTELKKVYSTMLHAIERRWPDIPIVYLHFPEALETREKFVTRAREIRNAVETCALTHPCLHSFSVPSAIVKHPKIIEPGLEDFPYHYNQATYEAFADMIRKHEVLCRYF